MKGFRMADQIRNQKPETRNQKRMPRFGRVAHLAVFWFLVSGFWFTQGASAVTVDRIAALIDKQVLTVSEVSQMV